MSSQAESPLKTAAETPYPGAPGTETLINENNNEYMHTLQHAKK